MPNPVESFSILLMQVSGIIMLLQVLGVGAAVGISRVVRRHGGAGVSVDRKTAKIAGMLIAAVVSIVLAIMFLPGLLPSAEQLPFRVTPLVIRGFILIATAIATSAVIAKLFGAKAGAKVVGALVSVLVFLLALNYAPERLAWISARALTIGAFVTIVVGSAFAVIVVLAIRERISAGRFIVLAAALLALSAILFASAAESAKTTDGPALKDLPKATATPTATPTATSTSPAPSPTPTPTANATNASKEINASVTLTFLYGTIELEDPPCQTLSESGKPEGFKVRDYKGDYAVIPIESPIFLDTKDNRPIGTCYPALTATSKVCYISVSVPPGTTVVAKTRLAYDTEFVCGGKNASSNGTVTDRASIPPSGLTVSVSIAPANATNKTKPAPTPTATPSSEACIPRTRGCEADASSWYSCRDDSTKQINPCPPGTKCTGDAECR